MPKGKSNKETLATVKPGQQLAVSQVKALGTMVAELLTEVSTRRKGILLVYDSLQNTLGLFFQMFNWRVEYEVRFERGNWDPERMVFDIVATKGRRVVIIEVKDVVSPRELGQVWGYTKAIQLSGEKAKVYLGSDILNYGDLVEGTRGSMIQELMAKENVGVILADKYVVLQFHNYRQLMLEEMPELWVSEARVG